MPRLVSVIVRLPFLASAAWADDKSSTDAARAEIKAAFGGVPTFVDAIADPALPGIWSEERNLILSKDTALDSKTKALILLAISAQVPCMYCIYSDTLDAKRAGAPDKVIAEAVAVSGMARNLSTILNGMQVDFATYKAEMVGN